jgi:mutator protein MutT
VIAEYADKYRFCPRCGKPVAKAPDRPVFKCLHCDFVLYFNPAVAAAALIFNPQGQILVIRRAQNPAQDKLAFPGGFIDAGETAEEAVRREVREEVGLNLDQVDYLCSFPNRYPYQGVTYLVLDFFFIARTREPGNIAAPGEVRGLFWTSPESIQLDDLAFSSLKKTWSYYQTVWRPQPPPG